jgi:hypothetical protein
MDSFITEWDGELKSGMSVGLSGIAPKDKKEVTTNLESIGIKITNKEFDMLVSANSHRTAKVQRAETKKLPIVSLEMIRDAIHSSSDASPSSDNSAQVCFI